MHPVFNNVLFIGPENDFGGMGAVLDIYKKNIQPFNFIATYPSNNKKSKSIFFIKSIFKISRFLFQNQYIKIIHLHSASRGSFYRKSIICLLGKFFCKKIVFHMHGGSFDQFYRQSVILKYYIHGILKSSDSIICLSGEWVDFYCKKLGLKNVFVLGNPIQSFPCDVAHSNSDYLQLLFLGNICDDKGIFDLIAFLKDNIYFQENKIKLTIAGIGEVERLKKVLENPELKNKINFLGWVQNEAKQAIICACDIYILPSYFEGLPVSILEAMAIGKPIIATNVGGIPSIVQNGYNGWLFTAGKFNELNAIFDQIFSDKKILQRYRLNSLRASQVFAPEVVFEKLNNLYTNLIDN
jgi:glycosyltransferase involved in cell wall biosynthesis